MAARPHNLGPAWLVAKIDVLPSGRGPTLALPNWHWPTLALVALLFVARMAWTAMAAEVVWSGPARPGPVLSGLAWPGLVWFVVVWPGKAWPGMSGNGKYGIAPASNHPAPTAETAARDKVYARRSSVGLSGVVSTNV